MNKLLKAMYIIAIITLINVPLLIISSFVYSYSPSYSTLETIADIVLVTTFVIQVGIGFLTLPILTIIYYRLSNRITVENTYSVEQALETIRKKDGDFHA